MGLVILIHGAAMVLCGAMRGLGMQLQATYIIIFSFYVISLPCVYLFCFKNELGLTGIWLGPVAGSISEMIIFSVYFLFIIDWD